jgi:hypothetical protein
MQATKDTFYVTLRDRLAQAYPSRTIDVSGSPRPALVVVENDKPSVTAKQNDAFYLEWGDAHAVRPAISTLMALACKVTFATAGTEQNGGLDRGRALAEMQSELLAITTPSNVRKSHWTGANQVDLGSTVFWAGPTFRAIAAAAKCVAGEAAFTVYFFPEANQS